MADVRLGQGPRGLSSVGERLLPRWVVALIAIVGVGGSYFAYVWANAPPPENPIGPERERVLALVMAYHRANRFDIVLRSGAESRRAENVRAALYTARFDDDTGMIEELVRRYRGSIDSITFEILLFDSASSGNARLVRSLLKAGASPNRKGIDPSQGPLFLALAGRRLDVIRVLLDAGADRDAEMRFPLGSQLRGLPARAAGQVASRKSLTLREYARLTGDAAVIALMEEAPRPKGSDISSIEERPPATAGPAGR